MSNPNFLHRLIRSPVARGASYFTAIGVGIILILWLLPGVREFLMSPVPTNQAVESVQQAFDPPAQVQPPGSMGEQAALALLLLVASLVFVSPIVWIYMVTKRQEGYEKTFVQVLFMLPVVVAAVVRVVRGDLALAFALAGIVAAVRFRTTLRDLKNAVFAFASIGIGLAAGTGTWTLAAVLAVVFTAVTYVLWQADVGGVESTLTGPAGTLRLSEALVPGETHQSVAVGSERLTGERAAASLTDINDRAKRLAHFVRADALKSKQKYDTLLLVYAGDDEIARKTAAGLLDEYAKRWHLVDCFPGPEDTTVHEYLLRLRKKAEIGDFLERLHCDDDCPLRAAEMKAIKGLRKLAT